MVKDREAWHAEVHGVEQSWTQLSDWTTATVPLQGGNLSWKVHDLLENAPATDIFLWLQDGLLIHKNWSLFEVLHTKINII